MGGDGLGGLGEVGWVSLARDASEPRRERSQCRAAHRQARRPCSIDLAGELTPSRLAALARTLA